MWQLLDLTFDSIRESEQSEATESAVAAVKGLADDLDKHLPADALLPHPSAVFADRVSQAIQRCLPNADVAVPSERSIADYEVSYQGQKLLVVSKWQADLAQPFAMSEMSKVIERTPEGTRLLVVVEAAGLPDGERFTQLQEMLSSRGRIVAWRSEADDHLLTSAVSGILGDAKASR
jgi:hypothetical protein